MDGKEIHKLFEKHNNDFLKFEKIEDRRHPRKDVCAFIYLHEKFSGGHDIIVAAEHDQIWLDYGWEALANITEEDIIYINRCGIFWDNDNESLTMFVVNPKGIL